LRTRRRFTVCTAAGVQSDVQIDGDLVVWADARDGRGGDIYARDLATDTEMAVSADRAVQTSPRVSGDTVVWIEERAAGWQISGAVVRN
jgi:beta propeller repeat protein